MYAKKKTLNVSTFKSSYATNGRLLLYRRIRKGSRDCCLDAKYSFGFPHASRSVIRTGPPSHQRARGRLYIYVPVTAKNTSMIQFRYSTSKPNSKNVQSTGLEVTQGPIEPSAKRNVFVFKFTARVPFVMAASLRGIHA